MSSTGRVFAGDAASGILTMSAGDGPVSTEVKPGRDLPASDAAMEAVTTGINSPFFPPVGIIEQPASSPIRVRVRFEF